MLAYWGIKWSKAKNFLVLNFNLETFSTTTNNLYYSSWAGNTSLFSSKNAYYKRIHLISDKLDLTGSVNFRERIFMRGKESLKLEFSAFDENQESPGGFFDIVWHCKLATIVLNESRFVTIERLSFSRWTKVRTEPRVFLYLSEN